MGRGLRATMAIIERKSSIDRSLKDSPLAEPPLAHNDGQTLSHSGQTAHQFADHRRRPRGASATRSNFSAPQVVGLRSHEVAKLWVHGWCNSSRVVALLDLRTVGLRSLSDHQERR